MVLFDAILLIVLALFFVVGFMMGFIRMVGTVVSIVAGTWVATRFYLDIFSWISGWWPWSEHIGKAVIFVICFSIVAHIVGWLFALFDQSFKFATIIPFLSTINRILGSGLGLVTGALIFGLLLYAGGRYIPEQMALAEWVKTSVVVAFLINFSKILAPLLPEIYKQLKSLV